MIYHVYILECADGSLYTGSTSALERRVGEHQAGMGSKYTRSRLPVAVAFSQQFENPEEAIRAERQLKGWSRLKKVALISGNFDLLKELARCRNNSSHTKK